MNRFILRFAESEQDISDAAECQGPRFAQDLHRRVDCIVILPNKAKAEFFTESAVLVRVDKTFSRTLSFAHRRRNLRFW